MKKSTPEVHDAPEANGGAQSPKSGWRLRPPASKMEWAFVVGGPLIIILALLAVPSTRYGIVGQFVKRTVVVDVVDSKTHKPVTDTSVTLGASTMKTDARGQAKFARVPAGSWSVNVSKKYYSPMSSNVQVPIWHEPKPYALAMTAIGNRVSMKVINRITGKPLAGATISALGTTATSDEDGRAVIVLPVQRASESGTLKLAGYNDRAVTIHNSETLSSDNTLSLTPSGKIYFLSKRTGVINVMKSDLDGANASVVIAGTGKETDTDTVLLASRDWRFLALKAVRDNDPAKLYVIDTKTDKLTPMDTGKATVILTGWYDHYFVFTSVRTGQNNWEPGTQTIKSYNADKGNLITLASTNASGTSSADAKYEVFSDAVAMDENVIFGRIWYQGAGYLQVSGSQDVLATIHVDGSGAKTLKAVDAGQGYVSNLALQKPNLGTFGIYGYGNTPPAYYQFDDAGNVTSSATAPSDGNVTNYLLSPGEKQTFWYQPRDGKNTLFVGNKDGDQGKQLASLSAYKPYGWFTDNYLLVSKNDSELYIAPADFGAAPIKITDYHKPDFRGAGYGGGYGGN